MSNSSYDLLTKYIDQQYKRHPHTRLFNLDAAVKEYPNIKLTPLEVEIVNTGFDLFKSTLEDEEISDEMTLLISALEEYQPNTLNVFLSGLLNSDITTNPYPNGSSEGLMWEIGREKSSEYKDKQPYLECNKFEALFRGFFDYHLQKSSNSNPYGGCHESDIWLEGYELAMEVL